MAITKNSKFKIIFCLLTSVFCILPFAGCQEKQKAESTTETKAPAKSNAKLSDEVAQLTKQVEGLMGINKEARTSALSTLNAVELLSKSGLYTNDTTKKKDRLVVYLKPIDDMGDAVKAAGEVNVELWNLNAKPENAMLAQWKVTPEELKKKWTSSLMSTHYKLDFDAGDKLAGKEKELTLKTQFTDYLTGKVFKSQLVINK
ncbi:MAG: hypothetical protein LLF92_02995 [Planctomycetaceae bacterium]|nr:hypothetical protein [Planctomycetaceae bacterium]